jgi:2-C-methyl-D-erythritol 4-phosphate cytidylyltransferase
MNASIPKQFLLIGNKPILMHTLDVFYRYDNSMLLILVLPDSQINYWKELCKKHAFDIPHKIVAGGNSRFESVKNGLAQTKSSDLIAIQDGVRPFVSIDTIKTCFHAAETHKSAIPTIDLVDSIREIHENDNFTTDRTKFKLVQTPQVFDGEILHKAYDQEFSTKFTDDASVVEALGHKVFLVNGNRENIKITTEMDLILGEALCCIPKI